MTKRLALIAGRGDLPALLIDAAASQGRDPFILAIKGDTNPEIIGTHPHRWIEMADIASTLDILKHENIRQLVMAGGLSRPSLSSLKPNAITAKILMRIGKSFFGGDDTLLKAVVDVFEQEGFEVIGADDILQELLTPEGLLTLTQPAVQAESDIRHGIRLMQQIGRLDIGQGLIIRNGQVIGVEALEGTDALIQRCGEMMVARNETYRGVLVKLKKSAQESRVDLPSIGPETISKLAHWGFTGLAVEAAGSLMIRKAETLQLAELHKIFIVGVKSHADT